MSSSFPVGSSHKKRSANQISTAPKIDNKRQKEPEKSQRITKGAPVPVRPHGDQRDRKANKISHPHEQRRSNKVDSGRKRGGLTEFSDDEVAVERKTQEAEKVMEFQTKPSTPSTAKAAGGGSLLEKYRKKLEGAKFRILNESLYTGEKVSTGLSQREFDVYHQGFARQVERWPTNPVDEILKRFVSHRKRKIEIGDFGCGDAKIAHVKGKVHNVHSFDLVAANDSVIPCDIGRDGVPLGDASLDMVIFSLSLMGSEVSNYIMEARRVLKQGGELVIAEVKSRFSGEGEKSADAMNVGLRKFCSGIKDLGFKLMDLDSESNTMFVLLRFNKTGQQVSGKDIRIYLKACEYKRR